MTDRIITRPDFDGIVCAVLLKEVLGNQVPVLWTQPYQMQKGHVQTSHHDVVANLPMAGPCALWFDHHVSNQVDRPFEGIYRIAPSAAGLIFEYFRNQIHPRLEELVRQADKIDAAQLILDEILHPENYPYILISMTISGNDHEDIDYFNKLVDLLRFRAVEQVMDDPLVRRRCDNAIERNRRYEALLKQCTTIRGLVSVTDFRSLGPVPDGNRFLVYSLYPQTKVNVKVFDEAQNVVVKLGHSIINSGCPVNVGKLLMHYGGGGHRGAGACRVKREMAGQYIEEIVALLVHKCSE
jgi:hypothetical protein